MSGYPLELDLRGKSAVVVGLGQVGLRKAAGLLSAGARVIGVDPKPPEDPPVGLEVVAEPYRPEHLIDAALVLAAASPEINRQVVADARRAGTWVNSATDPDAGDFTVPAVWREGPVTLSVSTSGASPALARALRDRAAEALGPSSAALVALLVELRPGVLERVHDPEARRRLLSDWADPRWLDLLRTHGPDPVRRLLAETIDREAGTPVPPPPPAPG